MTLSIAPRSGTHPGARGHHWNAVAPGTGRRRTRVRPGVAAAVRMGRNIVVEQRVAQTLADTQQTAEVMRQMLRLRDPKGVYEAGGCIDTTREAPRKVCLGTTDIVLLAI